jgi:hypothetical protein
MFRDSFNETVEIYRQAVQALSESAAVNVTAEGLLSYATLTNCGVAAVLVDLLEVALCIALLGCTSAVASLVMIFNIVTGVAGVLFVLLAILVSAWSVGNGGLAVVLCVAGTLCAGLSFFGFKVAEIVLDFVKATTAQMTAAAARGAARRDGKRRGVPPPIIERTKCVRLRRRRRRQRGCARGAVAATAHTARLCTAAAAAGCR